MVLVLILGIPNIRSHVEYYGADGDAWLEGQRNLFAVLGLPELHPATWFRVLGSRVNGGT